VGIAQIARTNIATNIPVTIDPVIVLIARFTLSWLFLASASDKLKDVGDFRGVFATYRVLPDHLVGAAAWFVVAAELAVGIGALVQFGPAYVGAVLLLLAYAGGMVINLQRGRRFIDCGCGGTAQPLSVGLVVRNLVLSTGALIALSPTLTRPLGWLDIVSVIVGGAVIGALYAAINELLAARARLEEWV
jgi:uncharacterized membrane protein YphA (DoxX/SURF4 family)